MKRSRLIITIVICVVVAAALLGGFYFSSNRKKVAKDEVVKTSVVQNLLLKDLERSYPPTPKEVLRYYGEVTKCFYNEEYSEEELNALALKIQELYDDELVANKTQEAYLNDLHSEIVDMKKNKYSISGYEMSASTDVDYFMEQGYSCARMYCTFYVKQGASSIASMEQFVLRQDEDGHWKILGWKLVE